MLYICYLICVISCVKNFIYKKVLNCYNFKMIASLKSSTQQENYKIAIDEEQSDDSISNQDSIEMKSQSKISRRIKFYRVRLRFQRNVSNDLYCFPSIDRTLRFYSSRRFHREGKIT